MTPPTLNPYTLAALAQAYEPGADLAATYTPEPEPDQRAIAPAPAAPEVGMGVKAALASGALSPEEVGMRAKAASGEAGPPALPAFPAAMNIGGAPTGMPTTVPMPDIGTPPAPLDYGAYGIHDENDLARARLQYGLMGRQTTPWGSPLPPETLAQLAAVRQATGVGPLTQRYLDAISHTPEPVHGFKGHLMGALKGLALGNIGGAILGAVDPNMTTRAWYNQQAQYHAGPAAAEQQIRNARLANAAHIAQLTGVDPITGLMTPKTEQQQYYELLKQQQQRLAERKVDITEEQTKARIARWDQMNERDRKHSIRADYNAGMLTTPEQLEYAAAQLGIPGRLRRKFINGAIKVDENFNFRDVTSGELATDDEGKPLVSAQKTVEAGKTQRAAAAEAGKAQRAGASLAEQQRYHDAQIAHQNRVAAFNEANSDAKIEKQVRDRKDLKPPLLGFRDKSKTGGPTKEQQEQELEGRIQAEIARQKADRAAKLNELQKAAPTPPKGGAQGAPQGAAQPTPATRQNAGDGQPHLYRDPNTGKTLVVVFRPGANGQLVPVPVQQ